MYFIFPVINLYFSKYDVIKKINFRSDFFKVCLRLKTVSEVHYDSKANVKLTRKIDR